MDILRAVKPNESIPRYMFADLVDIHSDAVYKFCRSLTYSREDADDLFQESFLKAFVQLSKLNASDNPQGFLFTTALYLWKSWKRKYARRNRLVPVESLDEAFTGGAGIQGSEDDYLAQEETRMVRELVDTLPEKFKIPIILYYTIEMNVPDIALTLQLPTGTIKSRLFKARKLIEKGLITNGYAK